MTHFNIRVYALITNDFDEILISDECRFGQFFSKFPGGGVEANEGIKDALLRELKEELDLVVTDAAFYYFNEFHQQAAFDHSDLIAFYYRIQIDKNKLPCTEVYDIPFSTEQERQRWVSIALLQSNQLTFPIDRVVLDKLKSQVQRA